MLTEVAKEIPINNNNCHNGVSSASRAGQHHDEASNKASFAWRGAKKKHGPSKWVQEYVCHWVGSITWRGAEK